MRLPKTPSLGFRLPRLAQGRMIRLLGAVLTGSFWLLALLTVLALLVFTFMLFAPLEQLRVTAPSDDGGIRVAIPRAYFLFGIGAFAGYFAGFALILRNLRAMIHTLRIGDPFQPANVSRLKQIGLTLATVTGGAWIGQTLVSRLVRGQMEPPSPMDLVTPAFSVLVVFVLAEVFREGARLRRESELTI